VRDGFLRLARAEPERWRVIDAARPRSTVATEVTVAARSLLEARRGERERV